MTAQLEDAPRGFVPRAAGAHRDRFDGRHASKHRTPVVKDVSFSVAGGRILGLVGESGSGKSTVGVALLGLARRGLEIAEGLGDDRRRRRAEDVAEPNSAGPEDAWSPTCRRTRPAA